MKTIYKSIIITLLSVVVSNTYLTAQEYKVIVNQNNVITSLTKKDVLDYFLKNKKKWDDGKTVEPVDLISNSNTRALFSIEILNKNVTQIRAYWQQSVFAGKASPPVERSEKEVVEFVKSNPSAIGYVSKNTDTEGTKTITIK